MCSFFVKEPIDATALAAFSPVILLMGWLDYANGLTMATALYALRSRLEVAHAILTMVCSVALVYSGASMGPSLDWESPPLL